MAEARGDEQGENVREHRENAGEIVRENQLARDALRIVFANQRRQAGAKPPPMIDPTAQPKPDQKFKQYWFTWIYVDNRDDGPDLDRRLRRYGHP